MVTVSRRCSGISGGSRPRRHRSVWALLFASTALLAAGAREETAANSGRARRVEKLALGLGSGGLAGIPRRHHRRGGPTAAGTKFVRRHRVAPSQVATLAGYGPADDQAGRGGRGDRLLSISGELWSFFLLSSIDPSDYLARFSDLPFALFSLLAVAALARGLGASRGWALVAALLYATVRASFAR